MFPDFNWYPVRDGNHPALALYLRHYSARKSRAKFGTRNWERFVGPTANSLILLTSACDALFVWRWEKYRKDKQEGINCSIFRNEGPLLSSTLILEAEAMAWQKWPGMRLYTFVNPKKIDSPNPGYCFKKAGWQYAEMSKGGLHILEKLPTGG
jgi:hypothetical protein